MASTAGIRTLLAKKSGPAFPADATEFVYGDFLSTDDQMDQVEARYGGGGMDGSHHLVARTGEQNDVTMPIYPSGFQLFTDLMTAAIGNDLAASVTVTGTDIEMHADVGAAHYITATTSLAAFVARSTFGAFDFATDANNRIYYTDEGALLPTVAVAGSATIAFDNALNQITGTGSELAGAVVGGWIEVSGSTANSARMRILSQPDDDTINVDPDSFTITTETAGPSITITSLHSVQLQAGDINGAPVDEAPGASVTLTMQKTDSAALLPLFAAATRKPPTITVNPWNRYDYVHVISAAYANTGAEATAITFNMGSTGTGDAEAVNPFTGTVTVQRFKKDDEVTKPTSAAHVAGPYGNGESVFFLGASTCWTGLNWTISRGDVETRGCAEEVQHKFADSTKPTMDIDGTIYEEDGDVWRQYQRDKVTGHYSQRWTSNDFRNGVPGSAAMIVDAYQVTVTSAEDVATGTDATAVEHEVTMEAAGESAGSWGAVTFIVHP